MSPNDADGMANSVDPDQTAPLGAVWSGSALFAQAYLSENLGSLRYIYILCQQTIEVYGIKDLLGQGGEHTFILKIFEDPHFSIFDQKYKCIYSCLKDAQAQ